MFFAFNSQQATKLARRLEKSLSKQGIHLAHGQALDALARMKGYNDWNTWKRQIDEKGWTQHLSDTERAHARDSANAQYEGEAALVAHTGFELRYDTDAELLSYVRVCDPLGRELAYWNHEEWQEAPQLVMGAILGALVRGQPALIRSGRAQASSHKTPAPSAVSAPNITDLDFFKAHAVVFGGRCYRIEWREEAALAYVGRAQADDYEDWEDETALQLHYEEDGLVWEEHVTVGELNALRWDSTQQCFLDKDGGSWRFFIESEFGVELKAVSPKPQAPVQNPVRAATSTGKEPKAPRRYVVSVEALGEDGSQTTLGQHRCVAASPAKAKALAIEELWDARLTGASCSAQADAQALDDDEDGPFTVFIDGGSYDVMDSFSKAWRVAQFMFDESAERHVHIEDNNGDSVFELRH